MAAGGGRAVALPYGEMVGAAGIEPATPAMSTQASHRSLAVSGHCYGHRMPICTLEVPFTFTRGGTSRQKALR